MGELAGGLAQVYSDSFMAERVGGNSEGESFIEQLASATFEDIGGELLEAGVDNALSAVNQLIMAEIFESLSVDGVPEAILGALTSEVVDALIAEGLTALVSLGGLSETSAIYQEIASGEFDGDFFNSASLGSLVLGAVLNEILPDLETVEGAIASAVTSALVATFANLGSFGGPVGAVVGFIVGKLFDSLFGGSDPTPQAWTSVGFDEETGRFIILDTWSDDGGNAGVTREVAQVYIDAMNEVVDILGAQSHNYSELANWSFGHYEDAVKNAGKHGLTFEDFHSSYLNAFVSDVTDIQVTDGRMMVARAIETSDVEHHFLIKSVFEPVLDLWTHVSQPYFDGPNWEMDNFNSLGEAIYASTFVFPFLRVAFPEYMESGPLGSYGYLESVRHQVFPDYQEFIDWATPLFGWEIDHSDITYYSEHVVYLFGKPFRIVPDPSAEYGVSGEPIRIPDFLQTLKQSRTFSMQLVLTAFTIMRNCKLN